MPLNSCMVVNFIITILYNICHYYIYSIYVVDFTIPKQYKGIRDCLDKSDVIQKIAFGCPTIAIIPDINTTVDHNSDNNIKSNDIDNGCNYKSDNSQQKFVLSRSLLDELSIRELKDIMEAYHISSDGCLYRSDIINRMESCDQLDLID